MRPPKTNCIFEISIKKYVDLESLINSALFLPQGAHIFNLSPWALGSPSPPPPSRVFHGQIFKPDKHKLSAPNAPSKSDPNLLHLKKLMT